MQDAMLKAYKEGLGVDFALVCEGVVKQVHSQVIMARSPYMEAKVNRWSKEKRELVIDDCDVTSFNIIVDFMYGIEIPESVVVKVNSAKDEEGSGSEAKKFRKVDLLQDEEKLGKLLEMSKRFLMPDLTVEVENLLIKNINIGNLDMFARLAENFDCEKLIEVGVKLMMREGDVGLAVDKGMIQSMPKFSATLMKALDGKSKAHDKAGRVLEAMAEGFEVLITTRTVFGADTIQNMREIARICRRLAAADELN